jgi:chromosome segregation ATPase
MARPLMLALVVLLTFGLYFDEASAQRRRRTKRSRRATNPVVTRPVTLPATQTGDPQIISTAEDQARQEGSLDISGQIPADSRRTNRQRNLEPVEEDSMRRTVNELSTQVTKLSDKLTQMEQQQRTLVDLERLSRAEQRAEGFRAQLRDVQEKEANLAARMEQIEFELRPDSIERSVAVNGSTRPEEAREARRRALESEKTRTRAQLDTFQSSRLRLEAAIITSDSEVDRLRKRIEETSEPQQTNTQTTDTPGEAGQTPAPAPTTSTPPL